MKTFSINTTQDPQFQTYLKLEYKSLKEQHSVAVKVFILIRYF